MSPDENQFAYIAERGLRCLSSEKSARMTSDRREPSVLSGRACCVAGDLRRGSSPVEGARAFD
jgi:hypothetical protein